MRFPIKTMLRCPLLRKIIIDGAKQFLKQIGRT